MDNQVIKLTIQGLDGFANALKFVQLKENLSEKELARDMGVAEASIKRWEGGGKPSFLARSRFAFYCKKIGIEIVYTANFEYELKKPQVEDDI